MADFILTANIAKYKKLLEVETDASKTSMVRKLLAEEEAKLASWHVKNPKPSAAG